MEVVITLMKVECDPLEFLTTTDKGLPKTLFNDLLHVGIQQHPWGYVTTIETETKVTLEQTGEQCRISCTSTFKIESEWDVLRNTKHQTTLNLYSELALLSFAHLRAFLLQKSKDTIFENTLFPYQSMSGLQQRTFFAINENVN